MVGQEKGIGVTEDKKKNHFCNYSVFDQATSSRGQHGSPVVRLGEKEKMGDKLKFIFTYTHTHTHTEIVNIYKLLDTTLKTPTCRLQLWCKPAIGREEKCFLVLF